MPKIDTVTQNIAIGRLQAGESQIAVARLDNVHRIMISRLLQRYQQSSSTADLQRYCRPRITLASQDRYIRVLHLRNLTVTARETASNVPALRRISAQRVRNRLREDVLALAQYWDVDIDLQGYSGATEYETGTCKTGGESGSAINQDSCCRKEMAVHVSTDAGMRGSQGTASLRSTILGRKCDDVGCHFLRPIKSTGVHPLKP